MKSTFSIFLFFIFCAGTVFAQKEYQVNEVSVINMGDGRLLFR